MYIKGANNVVVDALSRLPISKPKNDEEQFLKWRVFEDTVTFPLDFYKIKKMQDSDETLKKLVKDPRTKEKYKKNDFSRIQTLD